MHECSPRSRHPSSGSGARGDWAAWLPLVFIGALVFWTVALGLGGWSLMIVSDGGLEPATVAVPPTATAVEPKPGREGSEAEAPAPGERIPVQMQESQVPEDLDGSDVAALPGGALLGP